MTVSAKADESSTAKLSGTAVFRSSISNKDLDLGFKALDARLYAEAQQRLSRGLLQLNKTRGGAKLSALVHLGLAETYMGLDNLERARVLLEEAKDICFSEYGENSREAARYYGDLAELYLADSKVALASGAAEKCLKITEKLAPGTRDLALVQSLMGRVQCQASYYDEAKDYFKKALPTLELESGRDRLDYASALMGLAETERKLGNVEESVETMKKALALKDDAVLLNRTPNEKGLVKFDWVEGSYGSRQIVDPVYPLKYMVVGKLRVACTLVRSYKHLAVLISLANCGDKPIQVAVGQVELIKVSPGRKSLVFCDPGLIDEVLEEDVILDRTWRRRTLCHLQKSRRIPGYLKNGVLDPDDFFGNNLFGLYGAWDTNLRDAPPVVTREQFFYDDKPKTSDQEVLGFMRGNGAARPTYIETGAARTGLVFFLRERYEDALVKLFIGNAELRFPFHVAPGQ